MSNGEAEVTNRPKSGIGLGRVFGIDIRADFSLLLIFAIVAMSLGMGTLRAWHPDWSPGLRWTVALAAALLFFVSILLHELAHAAVARAQGLRVRGVTLFMFGGVAHIEREPKTPSGEFTMAIVGPLTSLAVGVVAMLAGTAAARLGSDTLMYDPEGAVRALGPLPTLLLWLGPVNLVLGVFNLVPGFPLDGGRVLRAGLWALTGNLVTATRWAAGAGQAFGWFLVAAGLFMALGGVVPIFGGGPFQGFWFVLIGWFLASSARSTVAHAVTRRALEGVPVRELMLTRFETVDPHLTVAQVMREYLLRSDQHCFPVARGDRFEGLLCWADVRRVPRNEWASTLVERVMTPANAIAAVRPGDSAALALEELSARDVEQVAVVDGAGSLVGLLRRRDVLKWMAMQAREPADLLPWPGEPSPGRR